jgi:hypothetical protein
LLRELSSRRRRLLIVLEEFERGVTRSAMIISMPIIARSQQRYDHRLRKSRPTTAT